jgi:hypothetical protein
MMHRWSTRLAYLTLLAIGCGGSDTRPEAMSAEAHRREAATDEAQAAEYERRDDQRGPLFQDPDSREDWAAAFGPASYDPSAKHRELRSARLRDRAAAHRAAAAELERYEEAECGRFPPETRPACPLIGQVEAVVDVEGGVRLGLTEQVPVAAAAAHMRCHIAYGRSRGREGMGQCPLYLEGVEVTVEGSTITLSAPEGAVRELRRRTHAHLEP